jgi:hypothetical protein
MSDSTVAVEIVRADTRLRRLAITVVVVSAVAGSIAIWLVQQWLDSVRQASTASAVQLFAALVGLMGLTIVLLVAFGVYLWQYGRRVRAASMFPPPGAKVIRDTPVLRGPPALRRGLILQAAGAAFFLCCVGLAAATWFVYAFLQSANG